MSADLAESFCSSQARNECATLRVITSQVLAANGQPGNIHQPSNIYEARTVNVVRSITALKRGFRLKRLRAVFPYVNIQFIHGCLPSMVAILLAERNRGAGGGV